MEQNQFYKWAIYEPGSIDSLAINQQFDQVFPAGWITETGFDDATSQQHGYKGINLDTPIIFFGNSVKKIQFFFKGLVTVAEAVTTNSQLFQSIVPFYLPDNVYSFQDSTAKVKIQETKEGFWFIWNNIYTSTNTSASYKMAIFYDGTIMIYYENIKMSEADLSRAVVSISDLYILTVPAANEYRYGSVTLPVTILSNGYSVKFIPNVVCIQEKSCQNCISYSPVNTENKCLWCPSISMCSNNLDRSQQLWMDNGCASSKIMEPATCPLSGTIIGLIVGLTLGFLVLVILIAVAVWFLCTKKNCCTKTPEEQTPREKRTSMAGVSNPYYGRPNADIYDMPDESTMPSTVGLGDRTIPLPPLPSEEYGSISTYGAANTIYTIA